MPLLLRRLLAIAAALSLALCAATIAMWVRSDWRQDGIRHVVVRPSTMLSRVDQLISSNGRLLAIHNTDTFADGRVFQQMEPGLRKTAGWSAYAGQRPTASSIPDAQREMFGVRYKATQTADPILLNRAAYLVVPYAVPGVAFAILPVAWLLAVVRRRRTASRIAAGRCGSCGYDLRSTDGRCPECGTVTATSSPAGA